MDLAAAVVHTGSADILGCFSARGSLYYCLERRLITHLSSLQTSTELEELSTFLNDAVAVGTEGLIVKTLDSTYEPSKRSAHWLKLKKDYLEGVGDTFDLVPIGAWFGRLALHARCSMQSSVMKRHH